MELQRTHLVPMIKHQMKRSNGEVNGTKIDESKQYLYSLFEHFCDSKRDYVNLTCIKDKDELKCMHPKLKQILFNQTCKDKYDDGINVDNIKLIFPNCRQLKNNMGYWIKLQDNKDNIEQTNMNDNTRFPILRQTWNG